MDGQFYLLTRKVDGDHGESFNQSVAVFAKGAKQAKELVHNEFARLRKTSRSPEHPYHDTPEFDVDKIDLDEHKLLIHWVSQ
jgi:hypothetical protein